MLALVRIDQILSFTLKKSKGTEDRAGQASKRVPNTDYNRSIKKREIINQEIINQ